MVVLKCELVLKRNVRGNILSSWICMRSIVSAITILTVLRRLLANRALWRLWFYAAAVSRKGCTNMTSRNYHNYNTAFSCIYFQINHGYVAFKSKLKYKPLFFRTAIRLVVIHPGSGDEPIRCHLMHTKLGERSYEALSYEWKEESDDDPMINVNGEDITVRKNLYVALMQLRLSETERHIWIDALSINQSKVKERNAKIKIMGQIYSGALRVIVWLGSVAKKSDTTLRMIKEVAALAVLRTTDRKSNEERYFNQLGQLSEGFYHEYWKTLVALCQRPHWCRIWVLQEVHLAKSYEVHCGEESISGSDIEGSIALFSGGIIKTKIGAEYCRAISKSAVATHRLAKAISPQANTLRRWITVTSSGEFVSTNPRDMIYALLGVSSDWQDGKVIFIPNYAKPLPDLFLDVVRIIRAKSLGKNAVKALFSLAERLECTTDAKVKEFLMELKTASQVD